MSGNNHVKGTKRLTSGNTPINGIALAVEQMIRDRVNTAEVVTIDSADQAATGGAAGYASATPLVCETDAYGGILRPASIPQMPFYRPQAGKAAIVMDPQPGDKAVAVFMKRDSSIVKTGAKDSVHPGSFRYFDQADGYLFNGFLGEEPEIWLHLNPVSGDISLSTKAANIDISCRESGDIDVKTRAGNINVISESGNVSVSASNMVEIKAGAAIVLTAPEIELNGNLTAVSGSGGSTIASSGGVTILSGTPGTAIASSGPISTSSGSGTSIASGGAVTVNAASVNVNGE